MVRQLIGSKKATPAVLGYIAATRAVQRAQRQEQERRQEERERDKAWGLEADRMEEDEKEEAEAWRDEWKKQAEG